jgi:hypothetical protein
VRWKTRPAKRNQPFTTRGQAAHTAPASAWTNSSWHAKTAKTVFQKRQANDRTPNKQPRLTDALPSPPPLPAGKGSESPSVVRGAGCAALRLLVLPPAGERVALQERQGCASPSGVARVLAFGCGPRQPPLRPLTPFPLGKPATPPQRGQADRPLLPAERVFRAAAGRLHCRRWYP